MKAFFLAAAIALSAGHAVAGTDFAAYEGPALAHGVGGTKISTAGVDFWTTGSPPQDYRILGVLDDTRGTGLFSGKAIGGAGVARRVKELGGDAVIVLGSDTSIKGAMIMSGGMVGIARRAHTRLLVVKYEDAGPTH